ncbi:MAG TPA: FAD-linked oxidase C-terminal domain-containing protein [Terriglobales bacterium]|jgi:glycolate oxidase|nr:FAD-linked oxidase C-terminal domain-containing protein [Terriglobales bacterium]
MDPLLVRQFRAVVGDAGLISGPEQLRTYECDGLTLFRVAPDLVLLPSSAQELQDIVKICHRERIPFVARGSGTGLSGGALPVKGGVVIGVSRMNHILDIDILNARVVVEPGVTNASISAAVAPHGYFYAPDPASQIVCTVGGNVAENSGGVHCFKYGVTTTYILALDVVLSDGSLVHLGDKTLECPGYDLVGAFVGSEGTFGIVTKITLRIIKKPECTQTLMAAFNSISEAGAAVSAIISAGLFPAGLEIMDHLAIEAVEAAVHPNYPNCKSLLLVELDGSMREVDLLMEKVGPMCTSCGAWEIRLAKSEPERIAIWKGRKAAFAAVGRISPNYLVQDGVIPRTALPRVLAEIDRLSTEANLRVANVFHAGDGNLHPLVLYDRRIEGQEQRAMEVAESILQLCVDAGGSISGEHGIGEEKKHFMPVMFSAADLDAMQRLRDAFDPLQLCNPTKMFPGTDVNYQRPIAYEPHPIEKAGLAQRY